MHRALAFLLALSVPLVEEVCSYYNAFLGEGNKIMENPLSIRSIVWSRLWDIINDVHENSDKSGDLTLEQEKKIEALDFYLCGALEIDMEENPDPDGG